MLFKAFRYPVHQLKVMEVEVQNYIDNNERNNLHVIHQTVDTVQEQNSPGEEPDMTMVIITVWMAEMTKATYFRGRQPDYQITKVG